jgi:small redox-active disulfide protein 2
MTVVKVLGPGCSNCVKTAKRIAEVAAELGVAVELEKETDLAAIMGYGALSTPGVVVDEKLVHAGGIPSSAQIREWLTKA